MNQSNTAQVSAVLIVDPLVGSAESINGLTQGGSFANGVGVAQEIKIRGQKYE